MMEEYELTHEAAQEAVSLFKSQEDDPPEWEWLQGLWAWLGEIWNKLWAIASEAAAAVWGLIGPWFTSLWNMVSGWFTNIWEFVNSWLTNLWEGISTWFTTTWEHINTIWTSLWELVNTWFTTIWGALGAQWEKISYSFTTLTLAISGWFAGIPGVITDTLSDPITDWLSGFIENIWSLFTGIAQGFKTWLIDFPQWMLEDFGERVIYGLSTSFAWVGRWAEGVFGNFLEAILGYIQRVGRIDPTNAPTVAGGLMTLVGTGVFALSAMTLAGELMHPLKEIGMGHISAMIGDVVNYRVISGAFMGALVGAALTTPLRYYFNYTLRPWLPDRRVIDGAMSRELFKEPEQLNLALAPAIKALVGPEGGEAFERRMLGYHGFADEWYPVYKELANSRVGYFALAAIARIGVFDEVVFDSEMRRAGYWSEARTMLLDMYRREALGEAKALYIGDPINAFKEGWFSQERLAAELIECGIAEDKLPRYLHAAWIKYEVDLLSDRLAGLKEAYRKGLVTDTKFTETLSGWGMAAERAEEHLKREQIRRYGAL